MRQRLELRHSQQLVMTPQLRQSIAMLQMSAPELSAFVAEEVERNPLLEVAEPGADRDGHGEAGDVLDGAADGSAVETASAEPGFEPDAAIQFGDAFEPESAPLQAIRRDGPSGDWTGAEPVSDGLEPDDAAPETLGGLLRAQLACARLTAEVAAVAEAMVGELDDDGWLRADLVDLAGRLGADRKTVEAGLAALQACEPTGVGARSLAECLALQLAERDRLDPAMAALLGMLDRVPTTPADRLAALCGVDRDDLREMLAELRALDPRPGLRFAAAATAAPVAADVLVRSDGAGGWRVELNPETMPRVLFDRDYAARVDGRGGKETRLFLADCVHAATWLQRSLDQRARTIVAVAAEIVRAQSAFFEEGVRGLRPLTLRQVAEAVGVHESTVSRVTANKHAATPRGLFELKFFFSTALTAADGSVSHAATAVRDRIRNLIAAEPPDRPLSDDHIVTALKAEGVEVARRTVAKYRESMKIPSSVDRRRRARAAV